MIKVSEIIGYPIVCIDSQEKEGEVKDILMDLEKGKIVAFLIECGSIFRKIKILEFNNIFSFEKNIISIKYKKNLEIKNKLYNKSGILKNRNFVIGKEVFSQYGNLLGFVQDILFKENDGEILGLVITNGILDDILSGIQVIPIHESISLLDQKIILSDRAQKTIFRNIGGLKKLLELEQ